MQFHLNTQDAYSVENLREAFVISHSSTKLISNEHLYNCEALSGEVTLGSLCILWHFFNNSIYQEVLKDGSADSGETGSMALRIQHSAFK